jgi:hypothetical protein
MKGSNMKTIRMAVAMMLLVGIASALAASDTSPVNNGPITRGTISSANATTFTIKSSTGMALYYWNSATRRTKDPAQGQEVAVTYSLQRDRQTGQTKYIATNITLVK